MNKAKILVVEDDKAVRNLITTTLETQNYQYHTAEKGSEALLEAVSFQPDVMLLDLGLPDMDGIAINLPAYLAGLPEEAYLSEFQVAPEVVEEESESSSDEIPVDGIPAEGIPSDI